MVEHRRPLGETLIEAGVLTASQLAIALDLQEKRQIRLGTILLQEGIVHEPQLVQALSRQLSIPWVSLWHIDIPEQLLKLVPVALAEEFFLIPIYVRSSPGGGEKTLYVAMNDPTDETALRLVSAAAGMTVRPMIAGPSDIAAAIRAYYFGEDNSLPPPPLELGQERLSQSPKSAAKAMPPKPPIPTKPKVTEPLEELAQDEVEEWQSGVHKLSDIESQIDHTRREATAQEKAGRAATLAEAVAIPIKPPPTPTGGSPSGDPNDPSLVSHQREVERHMYGIGHGAGRPKSVSLTLLDGTTISFGGARRAPGASSDELTKTELITALRASAEGTPVDGYLPSDKWEDHFAALLEVLFRKHLVSFEEYMEVLKKKQH